MKKKILSTLLAVSLFVGAAVPAVMADFSSTQAGDPSKIESIKFDAASYEIKQDDTTNFLDKILVFENNKKLILDKSQISFELIGNDTTFAISGSEVTAINSSGTATLVAKDDETGKSIAKVTLKAIPNPAKAIATSFKFKNSKNNVVYSYADNKAVTEGTDIVVVPIPAKADWSHNRDEVETAVLAVLADKFATASNTIKVEKNDDNELKFSVPAGALTDDNMIEDWGKNVPIEVKAEMTDKNNKNPKSPVAKTSLIPTKAKNFRTVAILSSKTIEVGQEFNLGDTVKKGASDANVLGSTSWDMAYATDNSEANDYATLKTDDGNYTGKVLGVAVGKNKIVVTMNGADKDGKAITVDAECLVTVVPAGSIKTTPNGKLSLETAAIAVGGTQVITVKDAPADAKITWKVSDPTIAQIAPFSGATTRVYAKKAGTVKVTALVDGVEIGSCEVTVKAADTTAPTTPTTPNKPSNNPQTGDSLFVNLF